MNIYDIFFSICLGFFIGGLIISIISLLLADIDTSDSDVEGLTQVQSFEHIDYSIDDIDNSIDLDNNLDYDFYEIDNQEYIPEDLSEMESSNKIDYTRSRLNKSPNVNNDIDDAEPAPFLLLFASAMLFFGITGIILNYSLSDSIKFITFIITPLTSLLLTKGISTIWKKIAISKYYEIVSTRNLIGVKGEVLLDVDERGGIIKVPSKNPLRYEKVHVKPLIPDKKFERGENVYVCSVKNNVLLVDNQRKSIRDWT